MTTPACFLDNTTFSMQLIIFYYLVYKLIYSYEKSASYNHRLKAAPVVSG